MAIETLGAVLRQINRLFAVGAVTGLSDAQLLERFVGRRDAGAFEALLARHGPMVLGVCRGILRDPNDAEDALQATFLILIKKAGSIRGNVILGGWLYQVAYRVALEANSAATRRRIRDRELGQMAAACVSPRPTIPAELLPAVHEEIARLSERYRLAVLLCDLEGKPQAQAAGELKINSSRPEPNMELSKAAENDMNPPSIAGRVLDPDGKPVRGATIYVQHHHLYDRDRDAAPIESVAMAGADGRFRFELDPKKNDGSVATDSDGRFELTGLGRDRMAMLRITRQGLETAYVAALGRNSRVPAKAPGQLSSTFSSLYGETGLELYGTTFEHIVGSSKPITGIVRVKGTSEPVVGVTVAGSVPGRMWSVVMTTTDERGHFRIDGLSKSPKYRVGARPAQGFAYLGWHPKSVSDTEGLKPIEITLELARGVAVRGRLIDKTTGQPVPCDWIQYYPLPANPDQGTPQGVSSGIDHSFRITVPHGGGMIAVKARGKTLPYPGARLDPADMGRFQIKGEDGSQFGIDLAIYHAYRFVDFPGGTESAFLDLEVAPVAAHKVELVGPTGQPVTGASAMGLTTDPFASTTIDGANFDVYGLRPGVTRLVEIRHEGLGVGGSVTIKGSDPADRPVVVKLTRYGAIMGRALDEDGLPLGGAKVSAHVVKRSGYGPSDPKFRPREAVTGGDGRFRIDGINPSLSVRLWFHKPGAPPYSHQPKLDKDLSNVTANSGETFDIGDVTVRFSVVQ